NHRLPAALFDFALGAFEAIAAAGQEADAQPGAIAIGKPAHGGPADTGAGTGEDDDDGGSIGSIAGGEIGLIGLVEVLHRSSKDFRFQISIANCKFFYFSTLTK